MTPISLFAWTGDDAAQFQKARKIVANHAIFIPETVLLETEWVLRFAYQFEPAAINTALTKLLGLPNVQLARPEMIAKALEWHQHGFDFADALHLAACQEQARFMTFDTKLIRKAKGRSRCQVTSP